MRLLADVLAVQGVIVAISILHRHQVDRCTRQIVRQSLHRLDDLQLAGLIGVGDGEGIIIAVGHFRFQLAGGRVLGHRYRHRLPIRVVGHAGGAARGLGDGVFIGARFGIGDLIEDAGLARLDTDSGTSLRGHGRAVHSRQREGEFFIRVITRCVDVARDLLGHLGLRSYDLVGVGDGQFFFVIFTIGHRRRQDAVFIHFNLDLHGLGFGVVGHTGGVARGLGDGVFVDARFGVGDLTEDTGLARLDGDFGAIGGHRNGFRIDWCSIRQCPDLSCQREGEFFIRVIARGIGVALDFLGHFWLRRSLGVGQNGQHDQRGCVVSRCAFRHRDGLLFNLHALMPPGGNRILHPAVFIAHAVGIHLIHADGDVRPVVVLVQGNAGLVGHSHPVGRGLAGFSVCSCVILVFQLALQVHGHAQVIVHIGLAVHQPLLGHSHAEFAGGVGVDQPNLSGLAADNARLLLNVAQVKQIGHVAHVAGSMSRIDLLRARAVCILFHLVGVTHRQAGDLLCGAGIQLIAISAAIADFFKAREFLFAGRAVNNTRPHKVLGAVNFSCEPEEEALAGVLACLILAVHEHALVHFKASGVASVLDLQLHSAVRRGRAAVAVRPFGSHAFHRLFDHGEEHICRQSFDGLGLTALHGQRRHAVRECYGLAARSASAGHGKAEIRHAIRVIIVDVRIGIDLEGIGRVLVRIQRAVHRLCDGQVARVAFVRERHGRSALVHILGSGIVRNDRAFRNQAGLCRRTVYGVGGLVAVLLVLGHLVGRANRQVRQLHGVAAVQSDDGFAVNHFYAAVDAVRQIRAIRVLQYHLEGKRLARVGRIAAHDRLADLQGADLVGVGHLELGIVAVILDCSRQRLGGVVFFHGNGHSMHHSVTVAVHIVGPAGIRALGLSDRVVVGTGLAVLDQAKHTGIAGLDFDSFAPGCRHRNISLRHSGIIRQRAVHSLQREGELLIVIIARGVRITLDLLGHLGLRRSLGVGQNGQHDQRGCVVSRCAFRHRDGLLFNLHALMPPGGNRILHPAVFIAHAVGIHLIHADGDVRPVVVLVQGNAGLVGHSHPVGRGLAGFSVCSCVILVFQLALQVHGHAQVIVHIGLAVHQPLLGHSHAEFAGGVGVDQPNLSGLAADNARLLLNVAQVKQIGHVAHVAGSMSRIDLLRARAVCILFHLVGVTHRQAGDLLCGAGIQLIAISAAIADFFKAREFLFAGRAVNNTRPHKVLGAVNFSCEPEEEALAGVLACLILAVHEHTLVHFKASGVAGVRGRHANRIIGRDLRIVARAQPRGGHAIHMRFGDGVGQAGRQADDGHLIVCCLAGQLDGGDAVFKRHLFVGVLLDVEHTVNIGVQGDGEGIFRFNVIFQRADHHFFQEQLASLAFVREGCCILFVGRVNAVGCSGRILAVHLDRRRFKPIHRRFGDFPGRAHRQISQQSRIAVVQLDGGLAAGHFHAAIRTVRQRRIVRVLQCYGEGEFLPRVSRVVAHDRFTDLQGAGFVLIGNLYRFIFARRNGLNDQVILLDLIGSAADVGPVHYNSDSLVSGIVRHTGRAALSLFDGEGIGAGRGNVGDGVDAGFVALDGDFLAARINSHAVLTDQLQVEILICFLFTLRQREFKIFIQRVIVAGDGLVHRDLEVNAAVGQLGQEDQRCFHVVPGCPLGQILGLDDLGLAHRIVGIVRRGAELVSAAHMIHFTVIVLDFHPAVAVQVAIGVHFVHANGDRRPVVGLGQFDRAGSVAVDRFCRPQVQRGGRPGSLIIRRRRALQPHGQFGVIIRHKHLAVHQPLLGDRDAVQAGDIVVNQRRSRFGFPGRFIVRFLDRHGIRGLGGRFHERHAVDVANSDIRVPVLLIFGDGVIAERQALEELAFLRGDLEVSVGGCRIGFYALPGFIIDHEPGVALGVLIGDRHVEGLLPVNRVDSIGLARGGFRYKDIVNEHVFGHFKRTQFKGVGDGRVPDIVGLVVDTFADSGGVPVRTVYLVHFVCYFMSVHKDGQVGPGNRLCLQGFVFSIVCLFFRSQRIIRILRDIRDDFFAIHRLCLLIKRDVSGGIVQSDGFDILGRVGVGQIECGLFFIILIDLVGIGALKPQRYAVAQAVLVFLVIPGFGRLDGSLDTLILVDVEDLREVFRHEFRVRYHAISRERVGVVILFIGFQRAVAPNLNGGLGPGVAGAEYILAAGFHHGIQAERQPFQHQHAVSEIVKCEIRFFRRQFSVPVVNSGSFSIPCNIQPICNQFSCNIALIIFDFLIDIHVGIDGELQRFFLCIRQLADVYRFAVKGEGFVDLHHGAGVVELHVILCAGFQFVNDGHNLLRRFAQGGRIKFAGGIRIDLLVIRGGVGHGDVLSLVVISHVHIDLDVILGRVGRQAVRYGLGLFRDPVQVNHARYTIQAPGIVRHGFDLLVDVVPVDIRHVIADFVEHDPLTIVFLGLDGLPGEVVRGGVPLQFFQDEGILLSVERKRVIDQLLGCKAFGGGKQLAAVVAPHVAFRFGKRRVADHGAVKVAGDDGHVGVGRDDMTHFGTLGSCGYIFRLRVVPHDGYASAVLAGGAGRADHLAPICLVFARCHAVQRADDGEGGGAVIHKADHGALRSAGRGIADVCDADDVGQVSGIVDNHMFAALQHHDIAVLVVLRQIGRNRDPPAVGRQRVARVLNAAPQVVPVDEIVVHDCGAVLVYALVDSVSVDTAADGHMAVAQHQRRRITVVASGVGLRAVGAAGKITDVGGHPDHSAVGERFVISAQCTAHQHGAHQVNRLFNVAVVIGTAFPGPVFNFGIGIAHSHDVVAVEQVFQAIVTENRRGEVQDIGDVGISFLRMGHDLALLRASLRGRIIILRDGRIAVHHVGLHGTGALDYIIGLVLAGFGNGRAQIAGLGHVGGCRHQIQPGLHEILVGGDGLLIRRLAVIRDPLGHLAAVDFAIAFGRELGDAVARALIHVGHGVELVAFGKLQRFLAAVRFNVVVGRISGALGDNAGSAVLGSVAIPFGLIPSGHERVSIRGVAGPVGPHEFIVRGRVLALLRPFVVTDGHIVDVVSGGDGVRIAHLCCVVMIRMIVAAEDPDVLKPRDVGSSVRGHLRDGVADDVAARVAYVRADIGFVGNTVGAVIAWGQRSALILRHELQGHKISVLALGFDVVIAILIKVLANSAIGLGEIVNAHGIVQRFDIILIVHILTELSQ